MSKKQELLEILKIPDLLNPPSISKVDFQGWNSQDPILTSLADSFSSPIVVEVGVWKGSSVIAMAEQIKASGKQGVVIAVDTFLGSSEHYISEQYSQSVGIDSTGKLKLFETFRSNVYERKLQDFIIPIPLDSQSAFEFVQRRGVQVDLIHLDAGHHYTSVITDLLSWWKVLKVRGSIVCDDYSQEIWPSVFSAVNDFLHQVGYTNFRTSDQKCSFEKSSDIKNLDSSAVDLSESYIVPTKIQQLHESTFLTDNQLLLEEVKQLDRRLLQINSSLSWRMTEPLRIVRSFFRKLL